VYTSRVSNFARYSPYAYFRSPTQSLAHDRAGGGPSDPAGSARRSGGGGASFDGEDDGTGHAHRDFFV